MNLAQVLVLNQDYQAISLCEPNRALVLIILKKAELVADDVSQRFRSVNKEFKFPSVIRLFNYYHVPYRKVALTRHNIFKRDNNRCVYCGSTDKLTIDHLIPKSQGGGYSWLNLVTACYKCNSRKGNLSPEQAGMNMRRKPYRPSFIMFLSQFSGNIHDEWRPYLLMN